MKKQNAIVIISPGFPASENDSTCLPERSLFTKHLQAAFPSTAVILIALRYPFQKRIYNWNGITVYALNGNANKSFLIRFTWLKASRLLKNFQHEFEIKTILSFWLGESAYIADKFSAHYGVPHYCWLLGQDAKPGNKFALRIHSPFTKLVAISDFLAQHFYKNYKREVDHIIPAAIDRSEFSNQDSERTIDILAAGSLIPLKNYSVLLSVVKKISLVIPQLNVVICGKGPEEKLLRETIINLGLDNKVTLTGELPRHELLVLMQHSKLFLHTSTYEGFGFVLAEALYAGAHVLSFTQPMHETFEHFNHVQHTEEMSEKAIQLLSKSLDHKSVLTYDISETIGSLCSLAGFTELTMSTATAAAL